MQPNNPNPPGGYPRPGAPNLQPPPHPGRPMPAAPPPVPRGGGNAGSGFRILPRFYVFLGLILAIGVLIFLEIGRAHV